MHTNILTIIYNRLKPHIPAVYFVFIAFILFSNNGNVSLWDQDEAAYAGFAKEMVTSGDWSVPQFMWSEIHRKPPLHFWNICLSYKLFGINEFSVRFPSALFTFFTYLFIYFAGRSLFGKKTAFFGAVVLSTSLFIPSLAKVSVTDATLLFFSTVCAFAVLYILQKKSLYWSIIFWIAFALALLTKGPPILLFTGVLIAILFLLHPDRKNLVALHPWFFLPIACLPLFLWGYYISQKDGGAFIKWMVDWYILKRVNGSVLGQTGPPGTHLLGLAIFFLPYFMFFPKAFWNSISGIFKKDKGIIFSLSAWFIAGWFLYEWSPSKLPAYVIAAHVPLAILIGKNIDECFKTRTLPANSLVIIHSVIMILLAAGFFTAPVFFQPLLPMKLYFAVVAIVLFCGSAFILFYRRSIRFIYMLIGMNLVFQLAVWVVLLPQVDELKDNSKEVADYAQLNASRASTVLIGNDQGRPPSLPFYLGLNFTEVKEEYNTDTLMAKFQSNEPYVLILNQEQLDKSVTLFPHLKFKKISSMLTDRNQNTCYYILINAPGCKNTSVDHRMAKASNSIRETI